MKLQKTLALVLGSALLATPLIAGDMPGEGVTVRPVTGTSVDESWQHKIIYRALGDLGYSVADPQQVEYQTIHLALGSGDADFTAVHWDVLHHAFFEESGGDAVLEKVGMLAEGALQGYLVNKAAYDAGITSLGDLKDPAIAATFDIDGNGTADLAGCVPGWGCERVIEHHLTEFDLRDTVTHNQGAYQAIIGETIARHGEGKNVLYYTWTPLFLHGILVPGKDVEWLAVPYSSLPDGQTGNTSFNGKEVGFAVDNIRIVARDDFLAANPAAAKLFEVAKIDINDISAESLRITNGEDSDADVDRHVDEWIAANQAEYDSWLAAARAAAN